LPREGWQLLVFGVSLSHKPRRNGMRLAGRRMKIAIIGAGLVGILAAHALMDDGHTVTLFDTDGLGTGTSSGNAGYIASTDILPLASPKMWRNLPLWLADPLGPLSIRPSYALAIAPWMLRFIAASAPARIEANTQALIALQGMSLAAWERRLGKLGIADKHLRRKGLLSVFTAASGLAASLPMVERQRKLGIAVETIANSGAVRALEPALSARAVAALHYPQYVTVDDPASISRAVGEAALARGAVLQRARVVSIRPVDGGVELGLMEGTPAVSDMAVIATGAWSKPLARQLGDIIPLDTERGYNVTLPQGSLGLSRPVVYEGLGFVSTPLDTGDRIGGAVEFAGLTAAPNFARVDAMLARVRPLLPDARLEGGTRWMGFRPSLPDSLPVISRSSASERILYAFGHGHYGLTQAAATGELIAQLAGQKQTTIDLMPFHAARF
jgi:D-amino-acid dehydrogenase